MHETAKDIVMEDAITNEQTTAISVAPVKEDKPISEKALLNRIHGCKVKIPVFKKADYWHVTGVVTGVIRFRGFIQMLDDINKDTVIIR